MTKGPLRKHYREWRLGGVGGSQISPLIGGGQPDFANLLRWWGDPIFHHSLEAGDFAK